MMKLVDMQGLKPCPLRGPGSNPGVGINLNFLTKVVYTLTYYEYIFKFNGSYPNLFSTVYLMYTYYIPSENTNYKTVNIS